MKILLKGLTALTLFSLCVAGADDKSGRAGPAAVGRYQITAAPVWHPVEQASRATLIKVDTASGRVWILERMPKMVVVRGEKKTILVQGWVELEKSYADAWREEQGIASPGKS